MFVPDIDPLFESAWLKWGHGVAHAQTLDADIDAFSNGPDRDPLLAVRAEYHPKRHGFSVYPTELAQAPSRWSLMLGDIAHNYRCSLDHLAWALVNRGTSPPSLLNAQQAKGVYFPICDDRTTFEAELRTPTGPKDRPKLPGIRYRDAAKVRRRQPYHYAPRTRPRHYLPVLGALNNRDKHRTVQPTWFHATRLDVEITRMQDCVVPSLGWSRRRGPLEINKEIAFIRARKRGSNPHLEVQTRVTSEPGIEDRIGVRTWIVQCAVFTALLLREFSAPPQEIIDRRETWLWLQTRAVISRRG